MSNGNKEFTKIYTETQSGMFDSIQSDLVQTTVLQSTFINGQQYTTVTGFAPTSFQFLAGGGVPAATTGGLSLLTSPNQVAAISPTDNRLLTLPAGAIVTRVLMSNGGGTPLVSAGTPLLNIGYKPITGAATDVTFCPAVVNCPIVGGLITVIGSTVGAPPAIADFPPLTPFAALPVSVAGFAVTIGNYGVQYVPITGGLSATSPSLVNVYNTAAAPANNLAGGQLKVQITYSILSV